MVSRESMPESVVPGLRYYTSPFNVESDQVWYHKNHVHKTAVSAWVEQADLCRLNIRDLHSEAKEASLGKFWRKDVRCCIMHKITENRKMFKER